MEPSYSVKDIVWLSETGVANINHRINMFQTSHRTYTTHHNQCFHNIWCDIAYHGFQYHADLAYPYINYSIHSCELIPLTSNRTHVVYPNALVRLSIPHKMTSLYDFLLRYWLTHISRRPGIHIATGTNIINYISIWQDRPWLSR